MPLGWRAAFLGWTAFVWSGRIRNALADDALDAAGRLGPVLLALSFLLPVLALVVGVVVERRRGRPSRTVGVGFVVLAVWTTLVWVVRAGDIALSGDRDPGFVAVHVALAVVSVGLGWVAVRSARSGVGRTSSSGVDGPVADATR